MIEGEQSFLGERRKELNGEKWIAAGLLVHQLRQRRGALRLAVKSIRNQLPEVLAGERRKRDLLRPFAPAALIASSLRISGWAASTSLSR